MIIIPIIYLIGGIIMYGWSLAWGQAQWKTDAEQEDNYYNDLKVSSTLGIFWPISLIIILFCYVASRGEERFWEFGWRIK